MLPVVIVNSLLLLKEKLPEPPMAFAPVPTAICEVAIDPEKVGGVGAAPEAAEVSRPLLSTVIFALVYDPAETEVVPSPKVKVPALVIGDPETVISLPPAAATEVTVPEPADPFAATVTRPLLSTVIFAFVYEPAATPEFSRAKVIDPEEVIGEPDTVSPPPLMMPTDVTLPEPDPVALGVRQPMS